MEHGGYGDCFPHMRSGEHLGSGHTRRARCPQGTSQRGQPPHATIQELSAASTPPQDMPRAYVALRWPVSLRDRLWKEAYGLLIATSCYEVSQPGGGIQLVQSARWGRRVSTQDIRPRWQAGHIAPASSCTGAALVSGGTEGGALTCCWSNTRHTPSFAWRTRF